MLVRVESRQLALAFLIAAGVVLRLAWILYSDHEPVSDEAAYRALATSLAQGQGYSSLGEATAYWVPGWPLFMSPFYLAFDSDAAVNVVNVGLAAVSMLLLYAVGRRVLRSHVAALIGVAWFSVWPSAVFLPDTLLSENLAIPLLLTVALLALQKPTLRIALFAGALCGALILTREQFLLVPLAVALYWWISSGRIAIRHSLIVVVVAIFCLTPWLIRNEVRMNFTGLSTSAGVNLYISLHEEATGGFVIVDRVDFGDLSETELNVEGRRRALQWAANNPARVVGLAVPKTLRVLLRDVWIKDWYPGTSEMVNSSRNFVSDVPHWSFWLPSLLLASYGWFMGRRDFLVLFLAGAVLLPFVIMFGNSRFHAAFAPLMFLYSAQGLLAAASFVGGRARLLRRQS